jgi:hypothetical protein
MARLAVDRRRVVAAEALALPIPNATPSVHFV